MAPTIRKSVLAALEDLSRINLKKFSFQLRDRSEEPKIMYSEVERNCPVEIADLLVSKFTEQGALKVVLETLRLIDCNQEAKTLESKTKACVDKGDPKTSNGKLDRKPLQKVENYAAGKFPLKAAQQGGAPVKQEQVAAHQREREHSVSQSPMTAQKVLEEFGFHRGVERAKESSLQPGKKGMALVGFGKHETETLKDLYESKDKRKIRYVNFLRGMKSTCGPGTKMDAAIRYILQRDQDGGAAATAPSRPVPRSIPWATRKRLSNSDQYASSSRPIQGKVKRTSWRAQQSCLLRY